MTILHHVDKAGINPKLEAQNAYTRMQYAPQALLAAAPGRLCGRACPWHGLRAVAAPSRAQDAGRPPSRRRSARYGRRSGARSRRSVRPPDRHWHCMPAMLAVPSPAKMTKPSLLRRADGVDAVPNLESNRPGA